MSKNGMIGAVVCALSGMETKYISVIEDAVNRLNSKNAEAWRAQLINVFQKGLSPAETEKNRVVEVKKLLKFLRTVSFDAIPEFVVAEKYREGETVDGIRVAWLGQNFKANFLKKIERAVPALEMREHELVERSRDPAIIVELGGEEQVETFLAHFWEFLKTADKKLWHVRYIRDVNGVLWAVCGDWSGDGLYVGASPLDYPNGWRVGRRFLSR